MAADSSGAACRRWAHCAAAAETKSVRSSSNVSLSVLFWGVRGGRLKGAIKNIEFAVLKMSASEHTS